MSTADRLPARKHLRPKLRRDLLAKVPPEVRGKLPLAFTDLPTRILV